MKVDYAGWNPIDRYYDTKLKNKGSGTARILAFPVKHGDSKAVEIRSEVTSNEEKEIHSGATISFLVHELEMVDDLIVQLQESLKIIRGE